MMPAHSPITRGAVAIYEAIGLRTGLANTLANVAFIRLRQGDHDLARQGLHKALSIAHENGDVPIVLEILIGFARYYYHTGCVENGVRLATLASHHPALNSQVRKTRLDPLLADLKQTLPPDHFAAAQAESPDLNAVFEDTPRKPLSEFPLQVLDNQHDWRRILLLDRPSV